VRMVVWMELRGDLNMTGAHLSKKSISMNGWLGW
jgi:hypothetical protein